jgi:hypothetical protein
MSSDLKKKALIPLIELAKRFLWSDQSTRKILQDNQINIIPANFYSQIPTIDEINSSFEYAQQDSEIYNKDIFNKKIIKDFIVSLYEYSEEFNPPLENDTTMQDHFFWKNSLFSYSDAMAYYCIIRKFKPDHILEIGSGYSTLIANQALKKNGKGRLTLIEPFPKKFLIKLDCVDKIIEHRIQDIPLEEAVNLVQQSDIWFIDSTHTVKIGSDCLYIYLKIMPQVTKDIIVHSHDIFLPFGMPKNWALEKHIYWTEQYLLYAYILDNPKIEVLYGSAYASQKLPDVIKNLMNGKYPGGGGSMYYRLKGNLKT